SIRFGIVGPAVGLVAGAGVEVALQYRLVRQFLGYGLHQWWPKRAAWAVGGAYLAGFLASRAVVKEIPGASGIVAALLAGTAVYSVVIALGAILPRDRIRGRQVAHTFFRSAR